MSKPEKDMWLFYSISILSLWLVYRFFWIVRILTQLVWVLLIQWLTGNIIESPEDGYLIVRYVWQNTLYKIRVNTRCQKPSVLTILDQDENMVTERVLPYMGPALDWHGQKVTPQMFGSTHFIMIDDLGEETVFRGYV